MKTLKRILWFAMALIMVMSLGVSAFAAETYNIEDDYAAVYTDGTGAAIEEDENELYAAEAGSTVTITNTLLTEVTVVKNWDDDGDRDGVRPDELKVTLFANGEEVRSQTMTDENTLANSPDTWIYTFQGLNAYDAEGAKINYTVTEESVTGYTGDVGDIADGEISITNSHENDTVTVSMTMTWNDDDNRENMRDEYTVAVFIGETEVTGTRATLKATELNKSWVLDKNDKNSHESIEYTVKEVTTPDGYTSNVVKDTTTSGLAYNITNTHAISYVNVNVKKVWDDDATDAIRPESVTFYLYADYHDGKGAQQVNYVTLNDKDDWEHTFTTDHEGNDLYNYANQKMVEYTIDESAVTGYVKNINSDNLRTSYEVAGVGGCDKTVYMLNQTITNTYSTGDNSTSYKVQKVWDADTAGILKTPVTVKLYRTYGSVKDQVVRSVELSSTNSWQYEFTNLPTEINDNAVTYKAEEFTDLGDDWSTSHNYSTTGTPTATITNEYDDDKLYDIDVVVNWDDNEDQDGKRPTNLATTVYAYDGDKYLYGKTPVGLTAKNDWTYSFEDMPRYTIEGHEITYKVAVLKTVEGYTLSVDDSDGEINVVNQTKVITYDVEPNEDGLMTLAFTETHTPETGKVKVTKSWSGGENENAEIAFSLLANNVEVKTGMLSKDGNNWTQTFENLPVYANGEKITYTVTETNTPNGYTPSYSDGVNASDNVDNSTLTITNTWTPGETGLNVTVVWDDNEDSEGFRPDEVSLTLSADGTKTDDLAITKDDSWNENLTGLKKYNTQSKEIAYTLTANAVDGYETPVVGEIKDGNVTVTYKRTPTYISYTVNPTWDDGNNQDGKRATTTLYLKGTATGYSEDCGSEVLTDNTAKTFSNLPKYANGEEITYTPSVEFTGDAKDIYTETFGEPAVDSKTGNYTTAVTLKHTPETVTFEGVKVWKDENDVAKKRPESVTLKLYAGEVTEESQPVKTVTVTAANNWEFEFEAVPVYAAGVKIDYTVAEAEVDGYESEVSVSSDWYVEVTNTATFDLDTSVTAIVKWSDNDDNYEYRPDEVGLTLQWYKNEEWVNFTTNSKVTTDETDEWSVTWSSLPKYDSDNPGSLNQYRVVEDAVDCYKSSGYGTSTNSYTITNTLIATEITVTKTWQDGNDVDEARPSAIGIELYKSVNGGTAEKVGETATLDADMEWTCTFTKLPTETADGEAITYSVKEVSAPSTGGGVINAEPIPVEG